MAANRIKGITIEIGGDTTKLQTALKSVNSQVKSTQQQLKDVEKLLKLDPGNTELLAQKHRLLGEAVAATKEKLEMNTPGLVEPPVRCCGSQSTGSCEPPEILCRERLFTRVGI